METTKHPFSADRPIDSCDEDKLGRRSFAAALADAIKGWKQRDSLVLALYGPWGSGKSSVKNMVMDLLTKGDAPEKPLVVEFNPWQWAGQDQLAQAFFHEIGVRLGKKDSGKDPKRRAAIWRYYSAKLGLGVDLIAGAKDLVPWFLFFGSAVGFVSLLDRKVGMWIAIVCGLIALVLKSSKTLSDHIAELFEAKQAAFEESLTETKAVLRDSLQNLSRPLIVIIDDVDRLTANETRLLFQLIKANADFPNLVYFLLFQRDLVEGFLTEDAPKDITSYGKEYLEKIVQVGFDMPRIEQTTLERFLFDGIGELLEKESVKKRFNNDRWWNVFIPGLRPYFKNMRDVNRFLGSLAFHASLFENRASFEVNPVDLIALEVIRVYEPEVYHSIFQAKETLLQSNPFADRNEAEKEKTRRIINAIVENGTIKYRAMIQKVLGELFPSIQWVFAGIFGNVFYGSESSDAWYRDLRVCHPNVFDRYFYFATPANEISAAELDELLAETGDREKFRKGLLSMKERGLIATALDRLEAYKEKIDLKDAVPFITALFDVGDDLPSESVKMFDIGADMHASRIIYWFLRQEKDKKKCAEILKEAINQTTGLYLAVKKIALENGRAKEQTNPSDFLLNEDGVTELNGVCAEKIRKAAKSGQLGKLSRMSYILYQWKSWVSVEEPSNWLKDFTSTESGLLTYLVSILREVKSTSSGSYTTKSRWVIGLAEIEPFMPIDSINQRLQSISLEKKSDKEKLAIEAFRKSMKKRKEGKPDDAMFDDD